MQASESNEYALLGIIHFIQLWLWLLQRPTAQLLLQPVKPLLLLLLR